jgi:hypothetical protein
MRSWKWAILIFELVLVAVILVLPQVDLPDFAFHGGTAPIVAKQRVTPHTTPAAASLGFALPVLYPESSEPSIRVLADGLLSPLRSSLSLFCVLIC